MTVDPYRYRPLRTRVSRRRVLSASAAAGAGAAVMLAGCGGGNGRAPAGGQPRSGGVLRLGTTLPIASGLDPQIETGTGLAIFPRIYGYLLHVDERDDTIVKDHALSVEQPDPVTYIFKLRPDVRFQDITPVGGRNVTADDIAASIIRYRDNPLVTSKTWHVTVLDRAEAVDATTLRVTTRRPYVYTLAELGGIGGGAILPREVVQNATDISALSIGSGPFRLDNVVRTEHARIMRNESYYRAPIPYLDAMEWTIFASEDARRAAFKARQLDITPIHDRTEADELAASSADIESSSEPSLACVSLGLRADRPPFNDQRVRGALDLGIDRDALIRDIAFGSGEPLGAVNPHLGDGYWALPRADVVAAHSGTLAIEQRRAAASALLEAAGAGGASFTLQVANVPQMIDVATVVRQQLLNLGLDIVMQEIDLVAWFTNLRRGQFEATVIGHLPYETPDIPVRFYHSAGPDGTSNTFGYADGTLDSLIERSWGETDRASRQRTLLEAQRMMLYARPMIQLFTSTGFSTAWKNVRNRHPELIGGAAQYNYEQWLAPI
jgi:peptide/nickel transport system substrate-binding protein